MIIKKDKSEIETFLVDAANYKGHCDSVYFPENADEAAQVIKQANKDKTTITIAGNGTGLTGARVPEGGIVISTDKMNKVVEINEEEKYAVVEPGVLLSEFNKEVENKGLFYPPDPTEQDCCIGGNVAANASGAKTFKYGPTRDYVLELDVILPTGESAAIKRGEIFANGYELTLTATNGTELNLPIPDYDMPGVKHAAGYYCRKDMDAIDLFIGSEGTLGLVTRIKLKLIDKPESILSSVIFFSNEDDALNFVTGARDASRSENDIADALGIEFFDKRSLKFLSDDYPNIPAEAQSAVWFEQELTSDNEEELMERWLELIAAHNGDEANSWFASDDKDRERFHGFRHAVSWKVSEYIVRQGIRKVGTDVAVPDDEFIGFYKQAIDLVENAGLDYVAYGHFGNSHLHLNMLPKNDDEYETSKALYGKLCRNAVNAGGTISAEHGIGKLKRNYLLDMFGEENIRKMAKLKKAFDPNNILGINNIFDEKYLHE